MVPQEKQNTLETTQTKEVVKESNSPKEKLQKIFETSSLKPETIENLKKILALVDINELNDFIIWEPDLDDVINKWLDIDLSLSLEWIIDNFLMIFWESKIDKKVQEENKKERFDENKSWKTKESEITEDITNTNINKLNETQRRWLDLISKNKEKYEKLFAGNREVLDKLNKIEQFKEIPGKELNDAIDEFKQYIETHSSEFFDTIAKSKDSDLYSDTIQMLDNLWVTIPTHIPREIYEVHPDSDPIPKPIVAQFPWAKPEDIEKRWNIVSYNGKTINLETGKAYISGEGWYAIETSMQVPNSLDLRVKYQKERLEIIDEIKTNEKILHLLENKETLKQKLETLKNNKSTQEKSAQDLQIDIEINAIETEIKKINEKLKTIVPWYKEDQDEAFKRFLEQKIEKSKESLKSLKEKFDEDMKKLLQAWQDEIAARDQKIRETISFLDDLWITNINQNDLQKIIDRINIHPHTYGFSKKIDLKNWFDKSPTDALKQKNEFFNLFSKIYEKMNFDPPVKQSIVEWFTKDERLKNDTTFKQKLEDIWVTKGWSVQIETMMSILWEKPEEKERERVYNGKPTQNEKVSETIQTK